MINNFAYYSQSRSSIKERIQQIRRKSTLMRLKEEKQKNAKDDGQPPVNDDIMKLTTSETRRNIGSMTCFLDPKMFEEHHRTNSFTTEEIWLPIKDITVTPSASSSNLSVRIFLILHTIFVAIIFTKFG